MPRPEETAPPIYSEFAHDPDMRELIDLFVEELPERIGKVRRAAEQANAAALRTLAHQLKGAAPGYGFTPLGDAAAVLERLLLGADRIDESIAARVASSVEELIRVCERASPRGNG